MEKALELLRLCTEQFPPCDESSHGLSMDKDGRLHLCLSIDDAWFDYRLDEIDMTKEPTEILKDVAVVMGLIQDAEPPTDLDHRMN